MKKKKLLPQAIIMFFVMTILCGGIYTLIVTGVSQLIFPKQANGSVIEVDGKVYGTEFMAQYYDDMDHMWGRAMNLDVSTYQDEEGNYLMYAGPSNLSPVGEALNDLVAERVDFIKNAHPEMGDTKVPVDLVTCSGSGLDPEISLAAAMYQVKRLARENGISEEAVEDIIKACTNDRFLGIFGEKTVNVLKVNLMLEGIL